MQVINWDDRGAGCTSPKIEASEIKGAERFEAAEIQTRRLLDLSR
jgi:hypothetical protein